MTTWIRYGATPNTGAGLTPRGEKLYVHIYPHVRALAMSGVAPENILTLQVIEDPEGEYMGWLPADKPGEITMIQVDRLFNMQFPYGQKASEEAGQGKGIRIRLEEIEKD